MSVASEWSGYDPDNLLLQHEAWPSRFQDIFENSEDAAESVARILYEILDGIHSGPEELAKAVNTLKDGIEYAYQYTCVNKMGLKLFLLYLDGKLEISDQPERVLSWAIERGIAATKTSEQRAEDESWFSSGVEWNTRHMESPLTGVGCDPGVQELQGATLR